MKPGYTWLEDAFREALQQIDLAARVRSACEADLPKGPKEKGAVRVIAIGKAAPKMLDGALSAYRDMVDRALAIVPHGLPLPVLDPRVEVWRAAHPVPDSHSLAAGERALAFVREAAHPILVLISGGASSLACAPAGVTLEEKAAIARALLARGAPIQAMNVVRRHLSRLKGGGLTRAALGPVVTWIASDVIAGAPHDVGSGPTVPDPTTSADATAVFARFLPERPLPAFVETLKARDPESARQCAYVIASPTDLVVAFAANLRARGFDVRELPPSGADVTELADEYLRLSGTLRPGEALIRAAEPTVTIATNTPGRGGRSGHLAALLALGLPEGLTFLAAGSDGVDGTSGAAGAIVDASLRDHVGAARLRGAIDAFDTATIHEAAGSAIRLGPTGHNLADVHVLVRQ